ncbi:MAG: TlpA family protein disulfide reductase [Gammaproteobacteria bacterium]|nr:TlpA family protein disulfide reductase [Gammaproteobacteria bacterium]
MRYIFILLLSIASITVSAGEYLRPFLPGSYYQILEKQKQKSFVMILWSVDCPPCHKELDMLGKLVANDPALNIVLVSTDIETESNEVQAILSKYHLDKMESWIFRGESDQSLRYEIDRRWYGELPRSYLFTSSGERQVVSGVLSEKKLLSWLRY